MTDTSRLARTRVLPARADTGDAEQLLAEAAREWGLSQTHVRRWVSSLSRDLPRDGQSELFFEYDPVTQLATVELWEAGRVVFGIDDWLGLW